MSYSQRGRMDEQRCTLSPVKTGQNKNAAKGWDRRQILSACMGPLVNWLLIVWTLLLTGSVHEEVSHRSDKKQRQFPDDLRVSLPRLNDQVLDSKWWRILYIHRWCDEFCAKCGLFPQQPGIIGRHSSAPQIAVTESTPDRNRKLLLVPVNQLQVPSQYDCSSSVKVCPTVSSWLL